MAKLIIAAFAAALWGAVAAAQSAGTYRGLGEAEGMTLEIESVRGGWKGAIVEADGRRLPFEASGGEVAEGRITGGDVTLYLRLRTHPMGVEAVIVPVDGQGTLYADRARALAFLRPGVEMPDASGTSPPPERAGQKVSARAFVASFAFWSPIEVAWGFDGIEPRFRTTIRLFPVVLADMLWKMCRSPERTPGLAEALRGQGVSCQDVSAAFLRL